MLDYIILEKKNDNLEVVETGFSYFALLYGPLWAAYHSLWLAFFSGLITLFIFVLILDYLNMDNFFFLIFLTSNIFWGIFGRDIHIQKYLRKKYYPVKIISASSKKKALIKYLTE